MWIVFVCLVLGLYYSYLGNVNLCVDDGVGFFVCLLFFVFLLLVFLGMFLSWMFVFYIYFSSMFNFNIIFRFGF